MRSKYYKFTIKDVAEASDLPESTVRRHRVGGLLDMGSVLAMSLYVVGNYLRRNSCCPNVVESEVVGDSCRVCLHYRKGVCMLCDEAMVRDYLCERFMRKDG